MAMPDHIDANQIKNLLEHKRAEVDKHTPKAFRTASNWYKSQVIKYAVAQGIPRAVLKNRWFNFKAESLLWLGINSFAVDKLGTPIQTPTGVSVKGNRYKGAFIWRGKVFRRSNDRRLPIEKVTQDYSAELMVGFDKFQKQAIDKFIEALREQVK